MVTEVQFGYEFGAKMSLWQTKVANPADSFPNLSQTSPASGDRAIVMAKKGCWQGGPQAFDQHLALSRRENIDPFCERWGLEIVEFLECAEKLGEIMHDAFCVACEMP
ncbi:MAG: hypothetical protein WEB60_06720 [Terrimicrobiaceae bacterium]